MEKILDLSLNVLQSYPISFKQIKQAVELWDKEYVQSHMGYIQNYESLVKTQVTDLKDCIGSVKSTLYTENSIKMVVKQLKNVEISDDYILCGIWEYNKDNNSINLLNVGLTTADRIKNETSL